MAAPTAPIASVASDNPGTAPAAILPRLPSPDKSPSFACENALFMLSPMPANPVFADSVSIFISGSTVSASTCFNASLSFPASASARFNSATKPSNASPVFSPATIIAAIAFFISPIDLVESDDTLSKPLPKDSTAFVLSAIASSNVPPNFSVSVRAAANDFRNSATSKSSDIVALFATF